jgi:hypothetical protein
MSKTSPDSPNNSAQDPLRESSEKPATGASAGFAAAIRRGQHLGIAEVVAAVTESLAQSVTRPIRWGINE